MRVIAGTAKRLQLKTIEGLETRPTTDRIKETLFNMISMELADCRFLDLFSGSGGIGIEALSRGAEVAYFVEKNPKAASCIQENLRHTRLADRAVLMKTDVLTALKKLEGQPAFDFIFMDPPYQAGAEYAVFDYLRNSTLADERTLIIVEAALNTDFSYLEELGYDIIKRKNIKQTGIFLSKDIEFFRGT